MMARETDPPWPPFSVVHGGGGRRDEDEYERVAREGVDAFFVSGGSPALLNREELGFWPARLPEPHKIPPRRWLFGRYLIKGYVTALVAPGGVGKTAFSNAVALAVATGRGLLGQRCYQSEPVLVCTLEDPEDEFDRRTAAAMIKHGIPREEVAGRLFVLVGRRRQLLIAARDADQYSIIYPDKDALIALCRAHKIGAIIVDPFVNSHNLDENANAQINAAARAWAEIAHDLNCAVLLIHHTRKGALAGDIESGRGAKALTDAARIGLTMAVMTEDEAATFNIPNEKRKRFVRVDDAKANLLKPTDEATWLYLSSVKLENGEPGTPWDEGDAVQAVVAWSPPSAFGNLQKPDLNRALDQIKAGNFSRRRNSGVRWVGRVLVEVLSIDDARADRMLRAWFRTGLLREESYDDPEQRKSRMRVAVDPSKRP